MHQFHGFFQTHFLLKSFWILTYLFFHKINTLVFQKRSILILKLEDFRWLFIVLRIPPFMKNKTIETSDLKAKILEISAAPWIAALSAITYHYLLSRIAFLLSIDQGMREHKYITLSQIVMGSGSKSRVRVGFGYHFSGSGRVRVIIFGFLSGLSKNPSGFRVFGFSNFCWKCA